MIQNPDKTCALVIGIESYGLGDDWKLPGARIGAEKFADWLLRQGLDEKRIYKRLDAKVDDIRGVLNLLKQERQDCDCLLFYWAGHGFETELEDRSLFLADAIEYAPKAFKIDSIISFLRNETPQFTRQVGIIDACASPRRSTQALAESIFMANQLPQGPQDFHFLLAAPSGAETEYPDEGKASVFTRRLLELLDTAGMTVDRLTEELSRDYPAIYMRDGKSKYWSGSRARNDAWALAREVLRLGDLCGLADERWRAEARRLDSMIDMPTAKFRAIVQKISGWEPKLAGKICVALLLRGAEAANIDLTEAIQRSQLLAPSYEAAAEMVSNLQAFENPTYVIKTDYRPNNELGVTLVLFLSGAEKGDPERLFESATAEAFDNAITAITNHMDVHDISSRSVIQLVVPLGALLQPPQDVLENEKNYPLVFRERKRAEGRERFRNTWPRFRDQLIEVKSRAAREFRLKWFAPNEDEKWTTVELPALRTGNCSDAERVVERLLETLTPFAAITRVSIQSLVGGDEAELAQAIGDERQFANIPVKIHNCRKKADSILPHVTVIWDDRELPKGYFH